MLTWQKAVLCIISLISVQGLAPLAPAQTVGIKQASPFVLPVVKRDSLLNGLQIILLEQRSTGTVTARLRVNSGALFDLAGKGGLADLTAGMLLRGGGGLSAKNIVDSVDQLGLTVSVNAGWDSTDISFSGPADSLEPIFDLLGRLVITPAFDQQELDSLKTQRVAAVKSEAGDDATSVKLKAIETAFGTNPYGRPSRGTPASIAAVTRTDLLYFHSRYYTANNAELMLIGDATAEQLQKLSRAKLGSWKKGDKIPASFRPPDVQPARRIFILDRPGGAQITASVAQPAFSRRADDYFAATIMADQLGKALSKAGSGAAVDVQNDPRYLDGPLVVTLKCPPAELPALLNAMIETMSRLASEALRADEIESSKAKLMASMADKLKTAGGSADVLLDVELYGLGRDYLINYTDRVTAITAADVQRAAKAYLKPGSVTIAVAGPAAECEAALKTMGTITVVK